MLSQAEASLSVSKGMIEIAKAKLSQAQSARQEQQALLNLKVSIRDRYNVLVDGGAEQREMLDEAIFAVSAVTAAIGKADADIAAAQADVGAAINEVEFAESGIQVAKAEQQPRNWICTPLPTDWVVIVLTTFVSFPKVIFVVADGGGGEGIGVGRRK